MGTGGGLVVIDFSRHGNSAHFATQGWSSQEDDRVWAVGPCAALRVPIQASGRSVIVEAELGPCLVPPDVTAQLVRLRANGTDMGSVSLRARSMVRWEIGPVISRARDGLDLEFDFPGFVSPGSIREGDDTRPLAAWFSFIRVYTTDLFKPGPHFPTSRPDIPVVTPTPPVPALSSGQRSAERNWTFGPEDHANIAQIDGWQHEPDGIIRAIRSVARITLDADFDAGAHMLRVDVVPPRGFGPVRPRDVTVTLDGNVVGQFGIAALATWIVPLPVELTAARARLNLAFVHAVEADDDASSAAAHALGIRRLSIMPLPASLSPDFLRVARAGNPAPYRIESRFCRPDTRTLADSIHHELGVDVAGLARGFETLGLDREADAALAAMSQIPLHLFRHCEGTVSGLIQALGDDLRCLTVADAITARQDATASGAVTVTVAAYGLNWRLPPNDQDADADAISLRDRFAYSRRKFFEGLRAGRKIYVLRQSEPVPFATAAALAFELNSHGPAWLLCVAPLPRGHQAGEVALIVPGIMRGYLDAGDREGWVRLLANAAWLRRNSDAEPEQIR